MTTKMYNNTKQFVFVILISIIMLCNTRFTVEGLRKLSEGNIGLVHDMSVRLPGHKEVMQ